MSFDNTGFAQEILAEALWWRYSVNKKPQEVEVSAAFQALFDKPVVLLEDLTGPYTTPIIGIKINEILETPTGDVRFATAYDTCLGKRSFQHQLKVYEQNGETYVWSSCIDVSERVALEREIVDAQGRLSVSQLVATQTLLEEQNRFISESYQKQSHFLAMLSHELRSPLLGISSLVERLRAKETDPETITALRTIHQTAEQSTFLVNDILTYSQTEYSEITLHPLQFSLKETLENVKQLTKSIAADKGLIVSLIYRGLQDEVVGDSVRLSQILINLIVNSIKFTQYGGVTVEVTLEDDMHFSFNVTDSGEGIAGDQLEQIFEPFAQLDSHGSALKIGSGLGLMVVRKLVALMGGDIKVHSVLGVGTSFKFDLYFKPVEQQVYTAPILSEIDLNSELEQGKVLGLQSKEENRISVEPSSSPFLGNILIADDSKINRMVLSGYLKELDYKVFEAKNGKEAWELFQEHCFEFVFLDIQMPFMDGIEVSRYIQESVRGKAAYASCLKGVYAITAGGSQCEFIPENESLESVGFNNWFVKPITKAQIIDVLEKKDQFNKQPLKASDLDEKEIASDTLANQTDWDTIDRIPEQFHGLIEPFILEMNLGLDELLELNKKQDWKALSAKAHYLKGNCMLFQLTKVIELLRKLETISKNASKNHNKQAQIQKVVEKLILVVKYLEKSTVISHNAP